MNKTYFFLTFFICSDVFATRNSVQPQVSDVKDEKEAKEDGGPKTKLTLQKISIDRLFTDDVNYDIFKSLANFRNSIPLENKLDSVYEEVFFYDKTVSFRSQEREKKLDQQSDLNSLLNKLLHKIGNKTDAAKGDSTVLYEKGMEILNSQRSNKKEAYSLFLNSSSLGNKEAKAQIAWGLLFGNYIPQNITTARMMFEELAEDGFPDGHTGMGLLHSLGLAANASQARALVHYTIGAIGGSLWSRMILGYRYWYAVSVVGSCEKALQLYSPVASHVASTFQVNGGVIVYRVRLLDEEEDPGYNTGLLDKDLLEYYEMLAEKGDYTAQITLGQLYYRGARGLPKDYQKALLYFQRAAATGNALALAFMGKIYLEGDENVEVDLMNAYMCFKQSADSGNPVGQGGLGLMYLEGKLVEKNIRKAIHYLVQSAEQGWPESMLVLGTLASKGKEVRKDYRMAKKYFTMASQMGHVLGYFNLGQMHATGMGTMRSCSTAVELFKNVAERGKWSVLLMDAYRMYKKGKYTEAFVIYGMLAEMGYEVAQSNAAFMLDKGVVNLPLVKESASYRQAKIYWNRSAMQGYPQALLKLGDYHFYGLGTKVDYDMAVAYYRKAMEQHRSPQAMFNIGYMHERGLGLRRDLHLAKRCYDMAAEASPDAEIPVLLALAKLYLLATWEQFVDIDWKEVFAMRGANVYLGPHWDLVFFTILTAWGVHLIYYRIYRRDLLNDFFNW